MTMHVILALVGYFVFSAAVGALSEPTEEQKRGFYGWVFRFLQALAANAAAVAKARFGSLAGLPETPDAVAASATSTATFERRIEVASSSTTK